MTTAIKNPYTIDSELARIHNVLRVIEQRCLALVDCIHVRIEVEPDCLLIVVLDRHSNIEYPVQLDDGDEFDDALIDAVFHWVQSEKSRLEG